MTYAADRFPLISVIIPTHNYASFLPKAIDSVIRQTYPCFEIIIIDDGSEDDTRVVIPPHPAISYFYQKNKGLAAARNTGIEKAKGEYFVFLDADDWLEKDALEQNYSVIHDKPHIAFVSGNYYLLRAETNETESVSVSVTEHHYERMLCSNYIGMHAAVMFHRWVFDNMRYDETLRACEDYDLYLRITRQYPVVHHQHFIATYYFHSSGLSHNYPLMMRSVTDAIKKQAPYLRSAGEKKAYEQGLQQWKEYYQLLEQVV